MFDMDDLSPCPFCSGQQTQIIQNTHWTGMRSILLSVEIRHWCDDKSDSVRNSTIVIRAKTEQEARDKWNKRIK